MEKQLKRFFFPVLLLLLVLVICIANYTPNTFLTGWDTLHPEFNFGLAFKRVIYGVWRQEQGVGAVAIHSHMSELPRLVFLWLSSLIVPTNFVRYLFFFTTLFVGPLGVYFFTKYALGKKENLLVRMSAFLAASYYLLNLSTLQHYFVPFEMFAVQFALLPWLFYVALRYIKENNIKLLIAFAVLGFVASPMAYAATLFYSFVLLFSLFVLSIGLLNKDKRFLKRSIITIVVLVLVNLYWILPNYYSVVTKSEVVRESKINTLFSPEVELHNKAYGNINDIVEHKSFLFSWLVYDYSDGEFKYLLGDWADHLDKPLINLLGYVLALTFVVGVALSFVKKDKAGKALFIPLVLGYFFLAGSNPPFGFLYSLLQEISGLFEEALRTPFTKFSTFIAFAASYYFAYTFFVLFKWFQGKGKKVLVVFVGAIVFVSLLVYSWPFFKGDLISKSMRTSIPNAYFELFDWFDKQEMGRVVKLPITTYSGWIYYDWGYQGAGLNWFGIKQPTFDRDSDRWSAENETFYHEFSTVVYGDDKDRVGEVLDKYDVSYVLVDESVIAPNHSDNYLRISETKKILAELGATLSFKQDLLSVYDVRSFSPEGSYVYAPRDYSLKTADTLYSRSDPLFEGNYIASGKSTYYPMANLYKEMLSGVSYTKEDEIVTVNLVREIGDTYGQELVVPALAKGQEIQIPVQIKYDDKLVLIIFDPIIRVQGEQLDSEIGKLPSLVLTTDKAYNELFVSIGNEIISVNQGRKSGVSVGLKTGESFNVKVYAKSEGERVDVKDKFIDLPVDKCWTREGKQGLVNVDRTADSVKIRTQDAAGCMTFGLGELSESLLSVSLPYRTIEGAARPRFCVLANGESDECEHDEIFYSTPASSKWTQVERQMVLGSGGYWMVVSANAADNPGDVWQIEYETPEIVNYPLVAKSTFDGGIVWEELLEETRFTLPSNIGQLNINVATGEENIDLTSFTREDYESCDLFERGVVEKSISDLGITYTAQKKGAICDHFFLPNMSTKNSYFLRLVGDNLKGRGLKLYLFNDSTGRNDLEAILPEKDFDKTFSVLSWPIPSQGSYTLNLETRSFGKQEAEDVVEKIAIYQVPIEWLAGWYIEPSVNKFGVREVGGSLNNDIEIVDVNKRGTYRYEADIKGYGLILLSQGYDSGWIAYENNGILPLVFGKKLEHVKANGWANGYIVSDQNSDTDTKEITIVYWPQYLQFFGFALLLLAPVLIMVASKSKKKQSS